NVVGGLGTMWNAIMRDADEELPEGTHEIVEHPDQPVGTSTSDPAKDLADNLERAGDPRPSEFHEPHHIAAANDPRAARAREILEEANIGNNSAKNGVWLPRTTRDRKSTRLNSSHVA